MNRTLIFFIIFQITGKCSFSQTFSRAGNIQVKISGNYLNNPWAGGLNNPQFSVLEMNGDGKKDLFVFDRSSQRTVTFINYGITGFSNYRHEPAYQSKFPPLKYWALSADYNSDGKEDIFTSGKSGDTSCVSVYRNNYTSNDGLKFALVKNVLRAGNELIYINEWDLPAIIDVDNDGDLDILTFEWSGYFMQYFKNLSMELYSSSDSLVFTLQENCWGHFSESFGACEESLNVACKKTLSEQNAHSGSTVLALDIDGDADKDLIIGDYICTSMYMGRNGGDLYNANMDTIIEKYPPQLPVDVYRFPAAFYLDVDNDGLSDLIAAPNQINSSENFQGVWYYKNVGTSATPVFSFQMNNFLQREMIETGEGAYPVFFDYNGDGLMDIVIGNYGYFSPDGNYKSCLSLYKNTGTADTPAFELVTRDYAYVSQYSLLSVHPAFGDLDGDGDKDMLIGNYTGTLCYFENMASNSDSAHFVYSECGYQGIDVGLFSAPQIVDVDRDEKPDLLIGEYNGVINYYRNTGAATSPAFTLVTENFGNVNVTGNDIHGYSVPFLTALEKECKYELLVGSGEGKIYRYTGIDSNLSGTFTLADTLFAGIFEGQKISVSGADINGDSAIDLAVGNYGGGIALFLNSGRAAECLKPPVPFSVTIYTMPVSGNIKIVITGTLPSWETEVEFYSSAGKKMYQRKFSGSQMENISISASRFASGIYLCRLAIDKDDSLEESVRKILVVHQ